MRNLFFVAILAWSMMLSSHAIAQIKILDAQSLAEAGRLAGKSRGPFGAGGQKLPKNSSMEKISLISESVLHFGVYTPQAQAAKFAGYAKEEFVELDSTNWTPELFNAGVIVEARCDKAMDDIIRMERIICLRPNDEVVKPIETLIDTVVVGNLAGAEAVAADVTALFPISLFDSGEDLRFYIFSNHKRKEMKIKGEDARKLR